MRLAGVVGFADRQAEEWRKSRFLFNKTWVRSMALVGVPAMIYKS